MKQNQRSKKTKLAIAIGATLLIAAGGWVFSTMKIADSFNSRLDASIVKVNQYVQNEDSFFIKPIFRIENLKTGFNTTEFTLVVEMQNRHKVALQRYVTFLEKESQHAPNNRYSEDDLTEAKAELATMPDAVQLFTIDNIASHGPLPLIGQFNFTPGLSHIQSTVRYNNLDTQFQESLIENLTTNAQKIMQDHIYFNGNTFIGINGHINSEMSLPAFNMEMTVDDANLVFGGVDLKLNIEPTAKTVSVQGALEKSKINSQRGLFSLEGLDFAFDINHANPILLPKINFNLRPVIVETPRQDAFKANYSGLSYQYEKKHNQDNITFDELMNLHSAPLVIDSNKYDYEDTQWVNTKVDISDIQLDFKATNLTQAMYEKYAAFFNWIEQVAEIDITELNSQALTSLDNHAMILREVLGLYRIITGDMTGTIAPAHIKIITRTGEQEISNFSAEIDALTFNLNRKADAELEPLNLSLVANGLKLISTEQDAKKNLNLSFKDMNFAYSLPTYHLYPISITHKTGDFEYKQTGMPEFKFNDLLHQLKLQNEADSLAYNEHYQLGNLDIMGANFGSLRLQTALSNLNLAAITLLETRFSNALASFEQKLESKDGYKNNPNLAAEIFNQLDSLPDLRSTLYSKGVTYQISPLNLQSEAGQANLNFSFKTYPLDEKLLKGFSNPQIVFNEILNDVEFNLDADINYLTDIAAKFSLLTKPANRIMIDKRDIESRQTSFNTMMTAYLSVPPLSNFIHTENNKLKSSFQLSDKQINLNGTTMTIDEFLATINMR